MRIAALPFSICLIAFMAGARTTATTNDQASKPGPGVAQKPANTNQAGKPQNPGSQGAAQKPPKDKPKKESLREVYSLPPSCFTKTGVAFTFRRTVRDPESQKELSDDECQRVFSHKETSKNVVILPAENAPEVADSFKDDPDFSVHAIGTDKIAIYLKSDSTLKGDDIKKGVQAVKDNAAKLTKPAFQNAEIISVPSGTATQLSQQLSSLKISGLTASPIGMDAILLKTDGTQGPADMDYIKKRLAAFQWGRPSAPPTQRLFELKADDVMKGLGGSSGGAKSGGDGGSGDKSDGSDKSGGASATSSPGITVNAIGSQQNAKATSDASSAQDGSDSSSDDNPQKSGTSKSKSKDASKDSSSPKPLTMQAVTDNLIYTNASGGDENIAERTRLITMLDLPRPEVLMNMSTFQVSSGSPDVVNKSSEAIREIVARHNELLQRGIEDGWEYLSQQSKTDEKFFDVDFYRYITRHFALDVSASTPLTEIEDTEVKDTDPKSESKVSFSSWRLAWGRCPVHQYCLGFAHAFEPPRPTFTNILLTLAAAADGKSAVKGTIRRMQKCCLYEWKEADPQCKDATQLEKCKHESNGTQIGVNKDIDEERGLTNRCSKKASTISQWFCEEKKRILVNWPVTDEGDNKKRKDADQAHRVDDCETRDRLVLAQQVIAEKSETLQLQCFTEQALRSFAGDPNSHFATRVGLLRAAIADFLFNYKMAQQYPHDFVPYDLNQSAQELNTEFNPLILAFNRDVAAFAQHLQTELEGRRSKLESGGWFGEGRGTFVNDAAIAVRGISGVESIVDTLTQNFFDATQPPSITDLVKSVGDAEKNIPDVLKANLTSHEAAVIVGALNSVKPAQAKIGRQLKLDITPHALAGASSAELEVQLTNQESADPTLFTADKSTEDSLSRVARHNTTTRVRIESLKLFEVSAFSALLQRPKSRFPLIPPFFEVPYFGSFLGIPLKGAKEYHRSTAIVSAIIVPTAADLAYGIDFSADRVCFGEKEPPTGEYGGDGSAHCYRAKSFADLSGLPFRNYHKAMVQCLATGGYSYYPGTNGYSQDDKKKVQELLTKLKLFEEPKKGEPPRCSFQFSVVPPPE